VLLIFCQFFALRESDVVGASININHIALQICERAAWIICRRADWRGGAGWVRPTQLSSSPTGRTVRAEDSLPRMIRKHHPSMITVCPLSRHDGFGPPCLPLPVEPTPHQPLRLCRSGEDCPILPMLSRLIGVSAALVCGGGGVGVVFVLFVGGVLPVPESGLFARARFRPAFQNGWGLATCFYDRCVIQPFGATTSTIPQASAVGASIFSAVMTSHRARPRPIGE